MERSILQSTGTGAIVKVTAIVRPLKAPLFNKDGMKMQSLIISHQDTRTLALNINPDSVYWFKLDFLTSELRAAQWKNECADGFSGEYIIVIMYSLCKRGGCTRQNMAVRL